MRLELRKCRVHGLERFDVVLNGRVIHFYLLEALARTKFDQLKKGMGLS